MFNYQKTSPLIQFLELSSAVWITQAMNTVARLGVADFITDGLHNIEDLATATQSNPDSLYRLLRSLASVGVFSELQPKHFSLTPIGEFLRSDIEQSLRYIPIMHGDEWHWNGLTAMYDVVKFGKSASQLLHGVDCYWEFINKNPENLKNFNLGMIGAAKNYCADLVSTYDFSKVQQVVDIAGGEGILISSILHKYPHLSGIIFEIPETVSRATQAIECAGLTERCRVVSGDAFDSVPANSDIYILSYVFLDWDDISCCKLLANIRQAMLPTSKLLVVDSIVPDGDQHGWAKWVDLFELCYGNGRVRTQIEFEQLYQTSGFRWVQKIPMSGTPAVVMELELLTQ